MRNRLMIGVVLGSLVALVLGISYIVSEFDEKIEEPKDIYKEEEIYTYISEKVDYLTFADDLNVRGVVSAKEGKEYIETTEQKNIKCDLQVGQELNIGDKIYEQNGKQVLSKNNIKLIEVITNEETTILSFLNYDNLCIITEVGYESYKKIKKDTPVEISFDGVTYKGDISYIDCVLNDSKVKVYISSKAKILPGADVDVRFVFEEEKEFLCISSEFVMLQGEKKYVQVNEGTKENLELKERSVELGKKFEIKEEGKVFVCYEVLNGLSVDEEIYIKVRAGEKIE